MALTTDGTSGSKKGKNEQRRPITERSGGQSLWISWAVCGGVLAAVCWTYVFFAPLTYGSPGLEVEEVVRRKWLAYDLHFAK